MTHQDEPDESPANKLCKACGLCCTGHLFIWAKLRPSELDPAEALGMHVYRDDPTQRGFSQPCPLWKGVCTIYASQHYPHSCRAYTCNLFDDVLAEMTSFSAALTVIDQVKAMIHEIEPLLAASLSPNFRERLVTYLEASAKPIDSEIQSKAEALLMVYEKVFGVKDLLEKTNEENDGF